MNGKTVTTDANPVQALRPLHALQGQSAAWANALLGMVAGLELYGVEKSFKMGPGQLLCERFLVGLQPPAWPKLGLDHMCSRLAMPERTFGLLAADLKRANFLGLAFEEARGRRLFKAYVEFPVPAQRLPGPVPGSVAAHLIYHGYKWDPDRGVDAALTRYWWSPGLSFTEISVCLARHEQAQTPGAIRSVPRALLARCGGRAGAADLKYLEAREDGGSRISFDLNLYAAMLRMEDVADIVRPAGLAFDIDPGLLDRFLASVSDRILGHVSAGIDRDGSDFVTLYYED
jgi:hypothetical protein